MTKNEIMKMAEQAGLIGPSSRVGNSHEAAERFANLVAAAEREACAKVADDAKEYNRHISKEIAAAIRARSQS
tara:strand:- start:716 stop:934 length:219 start_codon:yes stop_codon:yes gene_type:complete